MFGDAAFVRKNSVKKNNLELKKIAETVGMPKIDADAKWGVTVCKLQQGRYKWKLVKLKENGEIKHECLDEKVIPLKINDFKVEDEKTLEFSN